MMAGQAARRVWAMLRRAAAVVGGLALAACVAPATPDDQPAARPPSSLASGPVFSAGGARLEQYTAPDGSFPTASRQTWNRRLYTVDSFSRLDEIWPANVARRAPLPSPWKRGSVEPEINYASPPQLGGGTFTLDQYLERNPATGLIIARDDTILVERYRYGRNDRHRLTSFSMAKTVIALLIGIAVEEGRIASIEDRADRYAPDLAGSEYGATPIRHLLTMSSGVKFREEYHDDDDSTRLGRATFVRQSAGGAAAARLFNERTNDPGAQWYYASAETYVLALVLRAAIGQPIAAYLSDKIWQPIGAESDATWLVEATGTEIGYMGFNAVLRDYARLAMMLARGGKVGDRQVVPAAWLREATHPHFTGRQTGRWYGYGFQTWVFPENDGSFALLGVRGQAIFIDPRRRLVMVHTAVRPDPRSPGSADTIALWYAIKRTDF